MADWSFIIYLFAGLILAVLSFGVGRFLDNKWKCRTMRRLLKKNYIVLNITQKNGKTIFSHVVNADNDIAIVGTKMWIIKEGKIYDHKDKRKSYFITEKEVKYEDGAPVVFVNNEDLTPLDFFSETQSNVKPDEIGSTILAWVFNQLSKNLATVNQMKLIQLLTLGAVVLLIVLSFFNMQDINTLKEDFKTFQAVQNPAVVPAGGTIKDGNIVINQGSTTGGG